MKLGSRKKKTIVIKKEFQRYLKDNNIKNIDLADITGYTDRTISNFVRGKGVSKGVVQVVSRELEINQALIAEVVEA